jgi:hypothetical protein
MERLRVESFVVDYPGTQHAWQTVLKAIREGSDDPFDWMLDTAKLKLVPGDSRGRSASQSRSCRSFTRAPLSTKSAPSVG